MALNSKRERIILAIVADLEAAMDSMGVLAVKRRRPTLEQLQSIAATELPLLAVTAGLPTPSPHFNEQQRVRLRDKNLSNLEIEVVYYDMIYEDVDYDPKVSDVADDLWAVLNANQGWNGLAEQTAVEPDADVAIWDPYLAFKMKLTVTYIHGTGGI